jgi:hydroxyethylthiazole kinase
VTRAAFVAAGVTLDLMVWALRAPLHPSALHSDGRGVTYHGCNLFGVPADARAERRRANPSNLIRVMPAEEVEMHAPQSEIIEASAELLTHARERRPRVHCVTNTVAQAFTANILLALGAIPSMTTAPEEIAPFVARAGALVINLGTLDRERREACEIAIAEADAVAAPWVLDPVFVDRSDTRAAFANTLIGRHPHVIRLNSAEFATLAGVNRDTTRFALNHRTVIGLTGAIDVVDDGTRRAVISNGDALMSKVTAMGCAASALVAACLALDRDAAHANPWRATGAGLVILGVAGEVAAVRAHGPGSFAAEIIDAIHRLDRTTLTSRARVT